MTEQRGDGNCMVVCVDDDEEDEVPCGVRPPRREDDDEAIVACEADDVIMPHSVALSIAEASWPSPLSTRFFLSSLLLLSLLVPAALRRLREMSAAALSAMRCRSNSCAFGKSAVGE
jgi:hypothetical protein